MGDRGHILIADDEETFLHSTADLLRRQGYECSCAPDAAAATEMLARDRFDLLIADINMPGNEALEFIKELPAIAEGLPVILVTGYPTLDSAVTSANLPVAAYMVKPVGFEDLVSQVKASISRYQVYHAVHEARQRLQDWNRELAGIEDLLTTSRDNASPIHVNTFLGLTLKHIVDALLDLKNMTEAVTEQHGVQAACRLFECPRLTVLVDALSESIETLERTKGAFKSRQLGELRKKLEDIVKSAADTAPDQIPR